jgi:hypothetical protein
MQAVRELLVHVDDHRVLAPRRVARGIEQRRLEGHAHLALVVDQLRASPRVLAHERIRRRDLRGIAQRWTAREVIGRVVEVLAGIDVSIRPLRLCQSIDALVEQHQRRHRRRGSGRDRRVAGFLRVQAELRNVDWLRAIDPFRVGVETHHAMPDLTGGAVGELRRAAPIRLHFPHIQLVVEQH